MSSKQHELKRKLLAEREYVIKSLHRTAEHTSTEIDDTTKDDGDLSSASHDRELLQRLQEIETNHLRGIEDALIRMERDEYGVCEECASDIGEARLEAIPWARLCLKCQEHWDSTHPLLWSSSVYEPNELENHHAA